MSNIEPSLQKYIADLEARNIALTAENRKLRETLGLPIEDSNQVNMPLKSDLYEKEGENKKLLSTFVSINKNSSPEEKIQLFMSLFRGRTDVYAKRCYSKKHNSSYYIPACKNEWISGICDRTNIKCKDCDKRELLPLTQNVIDSHLRNRDENGAGIVGIYPLLPDDTCWLLAIDFDREKWKEDITVFRSVCEELDIQAVIERSRSGNGAHVWFFFENPVSAATARKFGNVLLTKAMSKRHEIGFTSYDRMFPNQDFMPKGGFGNLIALPLQGGARKNGNSEFVDNNFQSYPDQWAFLASVRKITSDDIKRLVIDNGLGELGNIKTDCENSSKPWETNKPEISLESSDFPKEITIIEANRLYIPKKGISQRAINRIKRLAAFSNPQFYKTQNMRISTYGIPRIICSLDETDDYIGIPRGCRSSLVDLFESSKVVYIFEDKRNKGNKIKVNFKGTLYPDQQLAAKELLKHQNGILSLPTAFGKTVIGASIIAQKKRNTLILVHLHTLLNQWKKALEQFLDINENLPNHTDKQHKKKQIKTLIGQKGSGKNSLTGIIDIALVQSLFHNNQIDDIVKNYGIVIVDECHHVPSVNYEKILGAVNVRYVYGLTATPIRQDGLHPVAYMQCGAIRYSVDAKSQAEKRNFEHYVIPCFTGFKKPFSINEDDWHITKIYTSIVIDEFRNNQIVVDVLDAVENNRTPIILVQRREHILRLSEMFKNKTNAHIITLVGADTTKVKIKTNEILTNIPDNEKLIIIATGKYAGEGFDYPRLDTLFLAAPIAWKGTLTQYAGRLHRSYPDKKDVMIYDYVDIHIPVLERMYHKRLNGYAQIGYKILTARNQPENISMIYNTNSFVSVIKTDFAEAKKEILIVSPFLRKKRVDMIVEWLKVPLQNGVKICIVTRPANSYKDEEQIKECISLLKSFFTVVEKPNIHQKFIIIDNRLIWYGSINLLSYGNAEESIMRLESRELAGELEAGISV